MLSKAIKLRMILLFAFLPVLSIGQVKTISPEEFKQDAHYLGIQLVKYHPNLLDTLVRRKILDHLDSVSHSVHHPVDHLQAYRMLAGVSSLICDGHTVFYPAKEYRDAYYSGLDNFPLKLIWHANQLIVLHDLSFENILPQGSSIVEINGLPAERIHHEMVSLLPRDGDNISFAEWIFSNYFDAFFCYSFGYSETYSIKAVSPNGTPIDARLKGRSRAQIRETMAARYPSFEQMTLKRKEEGIDVKILDSLSTAILSIPSFERVYLRRQFYERFRPEIKRCMGEISESKVINLVVDLRGNQGGNLQHGAFLLKYLCRSRFLMVQHYQLLKRGRLRTRRGAVNGFLKPLNQSFQGRVFLLIDGGSFSCSGIVARVLKAQDHVVVIGDESGGSAYKLNGSPMRTIRLPNSGIELTIPRLRYTLTIPEPSKDSGVMPDYNMEISLQSILKQEDDVLRFTLDTLIASKMRKQ